MLQRRFIANLPSTLQRTTIGDNGIIDFSTFYCSTSVENMTLTVCKVVLVSGAYTSKTCSENMGSSNTLFRCGELQA